jgi:hypothetical protein
MLLLIRFLILLPLLRYFLRLLKLPICTTSTTHFLTPCSTVLLEKPTGSQLVKFPALYGTRMFITAFTSAYHLSLS